ncbi:hypothetical protein WNY37_17115 [Henriciella sp. AS95]|uniref:hypothetical protein n=1 Tax=Henriciella sp. AS95 TaxID=3135782 RepID=UPI00317D02FB
MKKTVFVLAAAACISSAAYAEGNDTLNVLIANDAVITTQGLSIPIDYNEDGTYSGVAMGSSFTGSWRIEGDSLCTTSTLSPTESCTEYPEGKSAGDEFEVTSPTLGTVTVKINE